MDVPWLPAQTVKYSRILAIPAQQNLLEEGRLINRMKLKLPLGSTQTRIESTRSLINYINFDTKNEGHYNHFHIERIK